MSSVFLAADEQGKEFALKLLNLSLETEPEFRKRFQREAELTQRLDHANIVKTYEWKDDPEVGVYLVMEFVPGGNLRQRLDSSIEAPATGSKPWDLSEVVQLLTPIAQAVDYAHTQGVVHRDLKPENLLFANPETLKIADFGVARVEHGSRLTRTGVLPGTPEYMAPEQFSDQIAGPPADIYSLATIVYELLTGSTPFRSDNLAQILQRQAFERPQAPTQRREDLPYYLDRVVLKALEKKPEQRYRSAAEFLQALAQPPASGSHSARASNSGSLSDLPTRQVVYRQAGPSPRNLPWALVWAVWTAAAVAWCWRLLPEPERPAWLDAPLGWQPAPVGRQLCASVLWSGLEVALVGPAEGQVALGRARFAAALLQDRDELTGVKEGDDFLIRLGQQDWLRIDPQMAANLKARPEQIGDYWLALLQDTRRLSAGQSPTHLKELERRRPLRLDETPPRYPLLERLYERCRIRQRQGPLSVAVVIESLDSLGAQDSKRLREAARSVPLPKP